jgi:hypothetical protein
MLLFLFRVTTAAHRITPPMYAQIPVMRPKSRRLKKPVIRPSRRVVAVAVAVAVAVVVAAAEGGVGAVIAPILGTNGVPMVTPNVPITSQLMGSRRGMVNG